MDVECFFLPESTLFMMPASGEKKASRSKNAAGRWREYVGIEPT